MLIILLFLSNSKSFFLFHDDRNTLVSMVLVWQVNVRIADHSLSPLASGPYGLIFASYVPFFFDIPISMRFRVFGVSLSDKSFVYLAGLQVRFYDNFAFPCFKSSYPPLCYRFTYLISIVSFFSHLEDILLYLDFLAYWLGFCIAWIHLASASWR